jgi:hypothetical protein
MMRTRLFSASGVFLAFVVGEVWLFGAEPHGEFWWLHVFGFFALFGFAGCLTIVFLGKAVLGPWLQRKSNYYDRSVSP